MMSNGMTSGEGARCDGGMVDNPIVKAAVAGIAARTIKRTMGES
jgi:hypothetical protein